MSRLQVAVDAAELAQAAAQLDVLREYARSARTDVRR